MKFFPDLTSYYSVSCVAYFQQKKSPLAEGRAACSEILRSDEVTLHVTSLVSRHNDTLASCRDICNVSPGSKFDSRGAVLSDKWHNYLEFVSLVSPSEWMLIIRLSFHSSANQKASHILNWPMTVELHWQKLISITSWKFGWRRALLGSLSPCLPLPTSCNESVRWQPVTASSEVV